MLRNYLKSALRNLSKEKGFSFINVLGLALGMASFIVIVLYTSYELSYDDYHVKKDQLFRLQLDRYNKGERTTRWASGCAGIGNSLSENFGQVENFAKFYGVSAVFEYGDNRFRETEVYFATPSVFEMFTIPVLRGDASTMLNEPGSLVISKTTAERYFGDEDPLGQLLNINDNRTGEITGVFEDIPENSHMGFDILIPWSRLEDIYDDDVNTAWQWDGFTTYIQLKESVDPVEFEAMLPAYVQEREGEELKRWNAGMVFNLQPIDEIYLTSNFIGEFKTNGSKQTVTFLLVIAAFLILIAWVNYINLSTSKSLERAREVGIRKVMGSEKRQLVLRFLTESFLTNVAGVLLAVGIVILTWGEFQLFIGKTIQLSLLTSAAFWGWAALLLFTGTLLAGAYPAFIMSAYRPSQILKGKHDGSRGGRTMRRGLVVFQFAISMLLIAGTLTVYNQLDYMRTRDLGVNIDQTIVVRAPRVTDSTYADKRQVFKNEVLRRSEIASMAISNAVPGRRTGNNAGGVRLVGEEVGEGNQYRINYIDEGFVSSYELEIVAGRDFDGRVNDEDRVLMNEAGIDLMGFESPEKSIGKYMTYWGDTFQIVGVIKNFHQESLKKNFDPMVYRYRPQFASFFSLKVASEDMTSTLDAIEDEYLLAFPGNPFEYFFLDEYYDQQYRADLQFGQVFTTFSGLAIIIACLGLFGLASYSTVQRTKEIGIRKVLGASVQGLFGLVTREFTVLVGIGIIVAVPVAYYLMQNWLAEFAYSIQIKWWLFLLPAAVLFMTSVGTVAYHTLKAARTNPARSLRYE